MDTASLRVCHDHRIYVHAIYRGYRAVVYPQGSVVLINVRLDCVNDDHRGGSVANVYVDDHNRLIALCDLHNGDELVVHTRQPPVLSKPSRSVLVDAYMTLVKTPQIRNPSTVHQSLGSLSHRGRQQDVMEHLVYPLCEQLKPVGWQVATDTYVFVTSAVVQSTQSPSPPVRVQALIDNELHINTNLSRPVRYRFNGLDGALIQIGHVPTQRSAFYIDPVIRLGGEEWHISGFIEHLGQTPGGGHYVTYVRISANTWVLYNDQNVGLGVTPNLTNNHSVMCVSYRRGRLLRLATTEPRQGLVNLGNTCWMNAGLQLMIANQITDAASN